MAKLSALRRKFKDAYFYVLTRIFNLIFWDFRFSWCYLDWWNNRNFNRFLSRFGNHKGMSLLNADRKWHLHQIIRLIETVEGDTVECGTYTGESSYLICAANAESNFARTHHMFDSFKGVSAPSKEDGVYWEKGDLTTTEQVLMENLKEFQESCKVYKGWIPERFPELEDQKIAFVHIDVDLYEPTRDTLDHFYRMMSPGGIILCDDYGFATCPGATKAMDDFFADKPEKVIALSRGSGFIVKGLAVQKPATFS